MTDTLARHIDQLERNIIDSDDLPDKATALRLVEQLRALMPPRDISAEDVARDAGLDVRHDMAGFYILTEEEAEHEDEGNPSVGFDGRPHYRVIEDAWAAAAESVE